MDFADPNLVLLRRRRAPSALPRFGLPDDTYSQRRPERVLAQVMDLGDFDDVQALSRAVGEDRLREVLIRAEAGWFRPRSWAYWHHRLGLTEAGSVPPLPVRRFA
jgi:hypothetical protein